MDFILRHHFLDSHTETISSFHNIFEAVKSLESCIKEGKSANDEDAIELIATDHTEINLRIHYHLFQADESNF